MSVGVKGGKCLYTVQHDMVPVQILQHIFVTWKI